MVWTVKTTTRKESNRAKHKPGKDNNLENGCVHIHKDFGLSAVAGGWDGSGSGQTSTVMHHIEVLACNTLNEQNKTGANKAV